MQLYGNLSEHLPNISLQNWNLCFWSSKGKSWR